MSPSLSDRVFIALLPTCSIPPSRSFWVSQPDRAAVMAAAMRTVVKMFRTVIPLVMVVREGRPSCAGNAAPWGQQFQCQGKSQSNQGLADFP